MREIKFRVYDRDFKKMRYLNTNHDFICFHLYGQGYYENMQTGPGEWFSDLMQYTGLKDKNGKEIYEGDILKVYFDISTIDDYIFLSLSEEEKEEGYFLKKVEIPEFYREPLSDNFEVIGNIYDKETN